MQAQRNRRFILLILLLSATAPLLLAFQATEQPAWFVWVRQIAILITAGAAGGAGVVWAVNRLKGLLGWRGQKVLALAAAVSTVVAIAGMLAADSFNLYELRPENLSEIVVAIFIAARAIYETAKGKVAG